MQPIIGEYTIVHSTIRTWVLKVGLYLLERPKVADEWIYIIDASIQMGSMKCLLILGIQLSKLKAKEDYTILHSDLETLAIKTIESCNGEVVAETLLEAEQKTGVPLEIISDQGSEMKRGVRLYQETGRKVVHNHDIVHKIDNVLKKQLKNDQIWQDFTKNMLMTTQKLKLTEWAHLIPPKQRTKNRMLSERAIVKWGLSVLKWLDRQEPVPSIVEENLGWIRNYRRELSEYRNIFDIAIMAISLVRKDGYYKGLVKRFEEISQEKAISSIILPIYLKIIDILCVEEEKVSDGKRFLGSSESIEAVFGKFKQLEKGHASSGLTSLVLGIPALLGKLTIEVVNEALSTVSINRVEEWIANNLGTTFCAKRRRDLGKVEENDVTKDDYLEMDELIAVAI